MPPLKQRDTVQLTPALVRVPVHQGGQRLALTPWQRLDVSSFGRIYLDFSPCALVTTKA